MASKSSKSTKSSKSSESSESSESSDSSSSEFSKSSYSRKSVNVNVAISPSQYSNKQYKSEKLDDEPILQTAEFYSEKKRKSKNVINDANDNVFHKDVSNCFIIISYIKFFFILFSFTNAYYLNTNMFFLYVIIYIYFIRSHFS
jgi:hypothetical protein